MPIAIYLSRRLIRVLALRHDHAYSAAPFATQRPDLPEQPPGIRPRLDGHERLPGPMSTKRAFLVVRANGDMRVMKRWPRLDDDEVAFRLVVRFPDGGGRVIGDIELDVPDYNATDASAEGQAIRPEE